MKLTTVFITIFAGVAIAVPTGGGAYDPCSGLYDSALCCATDVLGVADLNCGSPPAVPGSASDFSKVCAGIGQRARCCVLPVLGQAVLCQTPAGVQD
ncbi:fungal hydrophobin [Cercophora newfieldiana]|uniref:Fungal hydrophobin n=1 Tax=Cercophora newfieldiana TaxID=92897 RepID=A0AA40CUA1_9PEZI|nr:fungal hydrophobin [Cercophora newfieldiana]